MWFLSQLLRFAAVARKQALAEWQSCANKTVFAETGAKRTGPQAVLGWCLIYLILYKLEDTYFIPNLKKNVYLLSLPSVKVDE